MTQPHILTVVGARPQFIKASALSRAVLEDGGLRESIVHTGQHFDTDMSDVFFKELKIPEPAFNLSVSNCSHGEMTGRMMIALEVLVKDQRPDGILIYGDTNSTLAGALVASKLCIPLFHVEAGLRSFNRRMPEEVNRVLSDHVSDLLFCPTSVAVNNLKSEGITRGVHHVGDIMYDVALWARDYCNEGLLGQLELEKEGYFVATVHRAENTDSPERLKAIFEYLVSEARDRIVVLPLHPRTRKILEQSSVSLKNILCIKPVSYLGMTTLLRHSAGVFTDSGGLQKEAYFHSVPCVTLRDETEWIETIDNGWNRLWTEEEYQPKQTIDEYGCGATSIEIIKEIKALLV